MSLMSEHVDPPTWSTVLWPRSPSDQHVKEDLSWVYLTQCAQMLLLMFFLTPLLSLIIEKKSWGDLSPGAHVFISGFCMLAAVFWFTRRERKSGLACWTVGLTKARWASELKVGLSLFFVVIFLMAGLSYIAMRVLPDSITSSMQMQKQNAISELGKMPLWLSLIVSLFAGFYEEVVFRGFFLRRFTQLLDTLFLNSRRQLASYGWFRWMHVDLRSISLACKISALLFGLGHGYQGLIGVVQTSIVGLILGKLSVQRGSIYAAMTLHACIDISSFLAIRVLR